jgi:hypothetical protein
MSRSSNFTEEELLFSGSLFWGDVRCPRPRIIDGAVWYLEDVLTDGRRRWISIGEAHCVYRYSELDFVNIKFDSNPGFS